MSPTSISGNKPFQSQAKNFGITPKTSFSLSQLQILSPISSSYHFVTPWAKVLSLPVEMISEVTFKLASLPSPLSLNTIPQYIKIIILPLKSNHTSLLFKVHQWLTISLLWEKTEILHSSLLFVPALTIVLLAPVYLYICLFQFSRSDSVPATLASQKQTPASGYWLLPAFGILSQVFLPRSLPQMSSIK